MNIYHTTFFAMAHSTVSSCIKTRSTTREADSSTAKESISSYGIEKLFRVSSPPTASSLYKDTLCVGHKSGEILAINLFSGKKERIAKDKVSVTSVLYTSQITLYGNRKGHIKGVVNGKVAKISSRHKSSIVSMDYVKNEEGDMDLITSSADKRIYVWKVVIENSADDPQEKVVSLIYLKTLYGPTTSIRSVSLSLDKEMFLCVAELSSTVRVFKIEKDTQLLFELSIKEYALEGVFIDSEHFLLCSSRNTLYLFSTKSSDFLFRVPSKSLISQSAGVPTLLKKVSGTRALLGFSSGDIFLLQISNGTVAIEKHLSVSSIPNSLEIYSAYIYILSGKEEKHSRFYINKSFSNGIYAISNGVL